MPITMKLTNSLRFKQLEMEANEKVKAKTVKI